MDFYEAHHSTTSSGNDMLITKYVVGERQAVDDLLANL